MESGASAQPWSKILTGILPLSAVFAFSVKLCPPWPPAESPILVSGTVESVEAIVFDAMRFMICLDFLR